MGQALSPAYRLPRHEELPSYRHTGVSG